MAKKKDNELPKSPQFGIHRGFTFLLNRWSRSPLERIALKYTLVAAIMFGFYACGSINGAKYMKDKIQQEKTK